jgi:sugar (pentulose or hexulose) kinase
MPTSAEIVAAGRGILGIELGSTRIKACLVGDDLVTVLATGSHEWQNQLVDGVWTYSLDEVWSGLRAAIADLGAQVQADLGVPLERVRSLGVSAMMHGYLAFDEAGELLTPFRTWRNTSTGEAAGQLSELFGVNIPLRWSIAHLHQAVLSGEEHVPRIAHVNTLAGYVHEQLTGRRVLGIGDASGMFPIAEGDYDPELLARYDALGALPKPLRDYLPEPLLAGAEAGQLTEQGAALLGTLQPGAALCPPEGDAGTGMVATNAVAPRSGNVSAGTSIFAMVVLEKPLQHSHHELDVVTTPTGSPVAMVHCNNGASELAAWVGLFQRYAELAGLPADADTAYEALFTEALTGDPDAGGLLAYNYLAGEPITGLVEGRPLFVRTPGSSLTLANVMRAQLYGVFGTLSLGMRVLADEGVALDRMYAHGGMFRTAGVAQRFLAAAIDAPVGVAAGASEGGAWGIALLAAYLDSDQSLADFLADRLGESEFAEPHAADVAGYARYLDRYRAGLDIEKTAVEVL